MAHTGMHELMLGMFVGGVVLAAPPVLIGIAVGWYLYQQSRRERKQTNLRDPAHHD